MSTYCYRYYEAKVPVLAGAVYSLEELPDITTCKEGDTYQIYDYNLEQRFRRVVNGEWVGIDKPEYKWVGLQPYCKLDKKPSRARYKVKNENGEFEWHYYEKESPNIKEWKSEDGIVSILQKFDCYVDNGGAIRDDYISTRGFSTCKTLCGRGFPTDIAQETTDAINYHHTREEDNYFTGWDATYVMASEWNEIYNTEEKRILGLLRDAYEKKYHNDVNAKLDFLIKNMKSPVSADTKQFYEELNTLKEDEDEYYDSPEYVIDEEMNSLFLIAEEYGRASLIADMYDVFADNIRIVYHLA